jgi:hypothetical protein
MRTIDRADAVRRKIILRAAVEEGHALWVRVQVLSHSLNAIGRRHFQKSSNIPGGIGANLDRVGIRMDYIAEGRGQIRYLAGKVIFS